MESVLGLIGLAIFCAAVIALAAGVTYLVIKISPASRAKKSAASTTNS